MAGAAPKRLPDFSGKRVLVIGLGIEGQDLARFFADRGAEVTVSDVKPEQALSHQIEALSGLNLQFSLGSNRAELADDADLVAVTQGAPLTLAPIARARALNVPITSRTRLFFEVCPGRIAGISGSSGKTTTTALTGAIFRTSGRATFVGGNIGGGLLTRLDEISDETWVILEVSHTQLQLTDRSPQIACLTNVTPNHLDQFSWDEYVDLKRRLIAYQSGEDTAVLNLDNDVTRSMVASAPGRVVGFSTKNPPADDGAWLQNERIFMRRGGIETEVMHATEVPLRGKHNLENALAATAIAAASGISPQDVREGIRSFKAVAHRLEPAGSIAGVTYINDSIATAPERTLAGVRAFDEPLVLLLGGREKHLPLEELATEAATRCRAVICFGEAGALLARACTLAHPRGVCGPFIRRVGTLAEAVQLAAQVAHAGDVVLLSPACTSFDAYDNFEQRGEEFRTLVAQLQAQKQGAEPEAATGREAAWPHR
jgi:UDP-N-acetylmuramoylalanine--D-glutamate ligase